MKNILTILLILLSTNTLYSQEPTFSQFFNTSHTTNPALIGIENDKITANLLYKNHIQILSNTFSTIAFSFDNRPKDKKLSWGILFLRDKTGNDNFNTHVLEITTATTIQLNKQHTVSVAFQGGGIQRNIDISSLTWNNQFDGNIFNTDIPSGETVQSSYIIPDLSCGGIWKYSMRNNSEMKGGLALFHLVKPILKASDNKSLPYRLTAFYTSTLAIENTLIRLQPSFIFIKQNFENTLSIGSAIRYKVGTEARYTADRDASYITGGMYIRTKQALVFTAGMSFEEQMKICFSYDTSLLTDLTTFRGGLEFSVVYSIR